ncbi:hypothetical protein [Shewanella sp.]|uniref:hypothetical protein n=1 Tax=Shewanella sp. TaxID=50422 RepID=UPI001EB74110|nr:hypothetical protein [Shewanella sp.]NRB23058.1 hypothetical protein [Shewanella sp.]
MKININALHTQLGNKATAFSKTDDENIKNTFEKKAIESSLKTNLSTTKLYSKEKKDNNTLDSSLIEGSAYEQIFKKDDLDFSNMSINELYSIVKKVNEMEWKYTQKHGSDEPTRLDKSGNPIISKRREDMNNLQATLEVLSFGGGNVDPDKNIDTIEYFSNSSKESDKLAKEYPKRQDYRVASSYMKEIINTLDKFISEDSFYLYQKKAALLLTDNNKVDVYI